MKYQSGKIILNPKSDFCNYIYATTMYDMCEQLYKICRLYPQGRAFEVMHENASLKDGKIADADNVIQPIDVIVENVRYSCKTECTKKTKFNQLNMSKYMECCHMRELNPLEIVSMYLEHSEKYDRIIFMQSLAYRKKYNIHQLFEIPLSVIRHVKHSDLTSIKRSDKGSFVIHVEKNKKQLYCMRVDGSARKIMLLKMPADICFLHARFIIPKPKKRPLPTR